ncbi:MAG: 50S ribosomal protein L23 [Patescibacteria group bacterium]
MESNQIILKPIVTEKATVARQLNQYWFWVNRLAKKNQIKQALIDSFGHRPVSLRTITLKGKQKYVRGTRRLVQGVSRKKAIAVFAPGVKLDILKVKKK